MIFKGPEERAKWRGNFMSVSKVIGTSCLLISLGTTTKPSHRHLFIYRSLIK
jgi:hypothetical protein